MSIIIPIREVKQVEPLPAPSMVELPCDVEASPGPVVTISLEEIRAEREQRQQKAGAAKMARELFLQIRLQFGCMLSALTNHEALDPLAKAHAKALQDLCAITLHRIPNSAIADGDDAKRIRDDLEALPKAVDPLVAAIGSQLAYHYHGVERRVFDRVLEGALEDAMGEASKAGRHWADDWQ